MGKGVFVGKTLFLESRELENTCGFVTMTSDSLWEELPKHQFPSQSQPEALGCPRTRKSAAAGSHNRSPYSDGKTQAILAPNVKAVADTLLVEKVLTRKVAY